MTRILRTLELLSMALLFAAEAAAQSELLVARRITAATAATDRIAGSDAIGGIGDWRLSNGVVEAIVDDVGFQADRHLATGAYVPIQNVQAPTGGTLVDLGLVGHDGDQLISVQHLVNASARNPIEYLPASFVLRNPALPAVIAEVDGAAGVASLTVHGFARLGPVPGLITAETRYSVRTGEPCVRVRTTLRNTGTTSLPVVVFGDTILHGRGGTLPFTPAPERGFTLRSGPTLVFYQSVLGRLGASDGVADTDATRAVGEVSYTFFGEQGVLFVSGDAQTTTMGAPRSGSLAPGATATFERRIYVGARNDAASSTDLVLAEMRGRFGIPMGRVRGRVVSPDGNPFRASLTVVETDVTPHTAAPETLLSRLTGNSNPMPITQIATDSTRDGSFEAVVPIGRHELWIEAAERDRIGPVAFTIAADQVTDVGDVSLSGTGRIAVEVLDEAGAALPARITLIGMDVPNPQLGSPPEILGSEGQSLGLRRSYATPWANVLYTDTGRGDLAVRPGRYRVVASHGIEYELAWSEVDVVAGQSAQVSLTVARAVDSSGWLGADLHVHASPSADSSVPPADRIRTHVAEGVAVLVSADHDLVFDYRPLIESMGLARRIASIVGVEVTTGQAFDSWASGVGHFNAWPLVREPLARKGGAPEDERSEPAVLYDRVRTKGARVVQLNHPFSVGQGFFDILGFDPSRPVGVPPNDALLHPSALGTGTTNLDFDAIEVYNGLNQGHFEIARDAWFSLLNQGHAKVATASSDSHDVSSSGPGLGAGMPRTYVSYAGTDLAAFDATAFDAALRDGRAFGTSGPLLEVEAEWNGLRRGMGETLVATGCCVSLHVRVRAPCWIPVGEVIVFANGARLRTEPVATGCTSALRYDEVLAVEPTVDTHYVIEAREILPRPPPASLAEQLGRLLYPQVRYQAFANPVFVDVDGNGRFDPPGIGGG